MQSNQSTLLQLGYLGLLPFVGGLTLHILDKPLLDLSGQQLFVSYSAIILSFLSGVLWGTAIDSFSSKSARGALTLSNAFALTAWAALLLAGYTQLAVLLLAMGFVAVWFAEKHLRGNAAAVAPQGYQTLRNRLTLGVVAMHLLFLLL